MGQAEQGWGFQSTEKTGVFSQTRGRLKLSRQIGVLLLNYCGHGQPAAMAVHLQLRAADDTVVKDTFDRQPTYTTTWIAAFRNSMVTHSS